MTAQEEQMNQLLQGLLSAPSAPVMPLAASAATAPDEEALLRSLFGLMQEQTTAEPNLDGLFGTDPSAMDDSTLIARLDQQFQSLCETFIALKTRSVADAHPEALVRLESYLAAAQAEIEALVPEGLPEELLTGLPESPVIIAESFTAQKKTLKSDS